MPLNYEMKKKFCNINKEFHISNVKKRKIWKTEILSGRSF